MTEDDVWNTLLRWHREVVKPDLDRSLGRLFGQIARRFDAIDARAARAKEQHARWVEQVDALHQRGPVAEVPRVR